MKEQGQTDGEKVKTKMVVNLTTSSFDFATNQPSKQSECRYSNDAKTQQENTKLVSEKEKKRKNAQLMARWF